MPEIDLPESFSDGHIALRRLRSEDSWRYCVAFRDDPELGAKLGMETDPTDAWFQQQVAQTESRRRAGTSVELAIVDSDPDADEFFGAVVLHSVQWHHRRAEVSVWVAPAARRAGIARQALSLILDLAFDKLELARIEMTTTPDNHAALAFADRLHFEREGVMRARNLERESRVDLVVLGLLREEWKTRRRGFTGSGLLA